MAKPIDWTHLFENYRGKWIALAEDETTIITSGTTAKEVHQAATTQAGQHFLLRIPEKVDIFIGYAF